MHREHPLRIIRYSIKNIWLLVFPLLRGIYSLRPDPDAFLRWIRGAWFDLLILAAILGFGWLRWYCRRYGILDGELFVCEGVLMRRQSFLPMERLSAMTLEATFWLRPFSAVYLYADTAGGVARETDVRLLIRKRDAEAFRSILPQLQTKGRCRRSYKVQPWRIVIFSVIFSSSLSGALYTAAFWFQGGRITMDLAEQFQLEARLSQVSQQVADKISWLSPATAAVSLIILFTWLLSLIHNLLCYGGFFMETDGRLLFIRSGILTRKQSFLHNDRINYLDIRQNFLTKLFRRYSLAVDCPGYGSGRNNLPVCLPLLSREELNSAIPLFIPEGKLQKSRLRPPLTGWWCYLWLPVTGIAAVVPGAMLCRHFFPNFNDVITFLQWMLLIPLVWKLIVQITALLTSGVNIQNHCICLRYCRDFTFHTIIAGTDRIASVRIRQYPWHRLFGKCHLAISFRTETPCRCHLRNVDYESAAALVREITGK